MNDLLTLLREHDLPPRWDGLATVWDGWETQIPAFVCPPPKSSCCSACGSLATPVVNRGRVARVPAVTHDRIREHDDKRARLGAGNGHLAGRPVALYRLHAFRCPDCRHDVVWDVDTDEWFDLDHTDYGPEGSTAP